VFSFWRLSIETRAIFVRFQNYIETHQQVESLKTGLISPLSALKLEPGNPMNGNLNR